MENKENIKNAVKFGLSVLQLVLSLVTLALCVKHVLNAFGGDGDDDGYDGYDDEKEDKVLFLDI